MKDLFDDFHSGVLPIERLNYGIFSLLPKSKDVVSIQKYRPICLLNVSYKILTKVLTIRLTWIVSRVISLTQTTFIKKRYIMEGVLLLHEVIHEVHRKKMSGVLLKIDFEKAYHKII